MTVNPATASLYIVNPLARHGLATLVATRPPLAERVRRLRALDHDQALDATGPFTSSHWHEVQAHETDSHAAPARGDGGTVIAARSTASGM